MSITQEQIQKRYDEFDAADNKKELSATESWSKGWDQACIAFRNEVSRRDGRIEQLESRIKIVEENAHWAAETHKTQIQSKIDRIVELEAKLYGAYNSYNPFNDGFSAGTRHAETQLAYKDSDIADLNKACDLHLQTIERLQHMKDHWKDAYWDLFTKYNIVRDEQNARVKL